MKKYWEDIEEDYCLTYGKKIKYISIEGPSLCATPVARNIINTKSLGGNKYIGVVFKGCYGGHWVCEKCKKNPDIESIMDYMPKCHHQTAFNMRKFPLKKIEKK